MYDDAAFIRLVNAKGVKLKAVAAAMGMEPSTLFRKRRGELDFSRAEIQRCCDFFGKKHLNEIFFAHDVS